MLVCIPENAHAVSDMKGQGGWYEGEILEWRIKAGSAIDISETDDYEEGDLRMYKHLVNIS